jgi:hypothetical protein
MNKQAVFSSLLFGLLIAQPLTAQGQKRCQERPSHEKTSEAMHYAAHLITEGLAYIPIAAVFYAGLAGGLLSVAVDPSPAATGIGGLAVASGVVAGGYIYYKVPEWTDAYILEYDTPRTTGQNLISLVSRLILHWPVGTVVGEFLAHVD